MTLKNRIKELRLVKASELIPHKSNWRTHPAPQQAALQAVLEEVGIAGALIARETAAGFELIDGHLRADTDPDQEWPVLVLDVDESEADKLLATLDPLAAMAGADARVLDELLKSIETDSDELQKMLDDLAKGIGVIEPPEDFPEVDENIEITSECPKCGFKWSGGK